MNVKRIFILFEVNKTGFIRLFLIEANWQILHVKRLKKEVNIFFYANIFKKNLILNEVQDLRKVFVNNLKQCVANIRWYANICKQIFA